MKSGKNEVEIALTQLKPGMFVVKLDIPWIDSPFLKHKRLLNNHAEIVKLKNAGVKHVVIDISKGLTPEMEKVQRPQKTTSEVVSKAGTNDPPAAAAAAANRSESATSLNKERNTALKIRALVMYLAHDIYSAMEGEKQIDKKKVAELTTLSVQSLKRNENALMNLVHIQQKSRKLTAHAFAVFGLALNFGLYLRLNKQEVEQLATAALLHEAGWIKLPGNLMGKRTAYNETETKLIQQHPQVGVSLLEKSELEKPVLAAILQHHEYCDGSGYPNKLPGDDIHKLAKILAICDSYDEWIHQLKDLPGMLPSTAIKQLYVAAEKGMFDREFVRVFISMLGIYPVTSAVLLNTGEKAVVYEIKKGAVKTPIIAIWYDKNGFVLGDALIVDLANQNPKDPAREILKIIDPDNTADDPANRLKSDLE